MEEIIKQFYKDYEDGLQYGNLKAIADWWLSKISARDAELKSSILKEFKSKLVHCGACLKEAIGCKGVQEFKDFINTFNEGEKNI